MTRRRLVIIAGAHKTASSHLQHSFLRSEAALRTLGIGVVGPKIMRRDLTPFSQLLRDGMTPKIVRAGANGFLAHHGSDADTIVLMDENILGGTDRKMLMRKSRLYPWGPRRVARLAELFRDHDIQLAIAIRNPATFLPSCWGESLHHARYERFERFVQGFDPTGKIWTGLIDRIAKEVPDLQMTVWKYEDYAVFGRSLYAQMLNQDAASAIRPDPQIRRAGLSQRAADWFQAQATRDKAALQEARKRYPKTGPENAFTPWTEKEIDTLSHCYERDVASVATRPGVKLLLPDA